MNTQPMPALPACRSTLESGCAQCSAAFSCHEARQGRSAPFWPIIALTLFFLIGVAF